MISRVHDAFERCLPNTSGGSQGLTPGFTETLMYHLRYTLIFIPDLVTEVCCKVKECHLCPWLKRNNPHNTFFMGRNDCHLFGIEFVFQGLSYRVRQDIMVPQNRPTKLDFWYFFTVVCCKMPALWVIFYKILKFCKPLLCVSVIQKSTPFL